MATLGSLLTIAYVFVAVFSGWTNAEALLTEGKAISNHRQPRHLLKNKLCALGLCGGGDYHGNQGYGGYQGGHQGGYGGYQGYPPINIGISQSQSSSSAGGSGYGPGYFPNNYQYNNGYGGYKPGYFGNGFGYNRPGNFENGFGSSNNQFNGNFYAGGQGGSRYPSQGGGYGFQGPFGNFFDGDYNDDKPVYENQDDYSRSAKSKD